MQHYCPDNVGGLTLVCGIKKLELDPLGNVIIVPDDERTRAWESRHGGATFTRATLEQRRGWAWQRFSLQWRPTERGEVLLSVRAAEAGGVGQAGAQPHAAMPERRGVRSSGDATASER